MSERQRGERGGEAERHRDHPRQCEAETRVSRTARDQNHRGERSGGCEDGVLQKAEPEHTDAGLLRLQSSGLERMPVDDEAASNDESAEAGRDDRSCSREPEARPALDSGDLAIGDDVPEVGCELHPERDRQPDRIEVLQLAENALEPRSPGNADDCAQSQDCAERDQERVLGRIPVEVRRGSQ
jgi:hypothetical protein